MTSELIDRVRHSRVLRTMLNSEIIARESQSQPNTTYQSIVKLLAWTTYPIETIEAAGRLCHDSIDNIGINPNWIQDVIMTKDHRSVLEHSSATFYIKASRSFSHEIVRHRIASYSQRSQRYVNEKEAKYVVPPEVYTAGDAAVAEYLICMEKCWETYSTLLKMNVKKEIARYVLPNACETQIICTWNFREIQHILNLRTSPAALPEMREVAGKIKDIVVGNFPEVFRK